MSARQLRYLVLAPASRHVLFMSNSLACVIFVEHHRRSTILRARWTDDAIFLARSASVRSVSPESRELLQLHEYSDLHATESLLPRHASGKMPSRDPRPGARRPPPQLLKRIPTKRTPSLFSSDPSLKSITLTPPQLSYPPDTPRP
jgi:hypothetical protein